MNIYVADTNVIIPFNHYYYQVFIGFWQKIDLFLQNNILISTESVYQELMGRNDFVAKWAKQNKSIFYLPTQPDIDTSVRITKRFPKLTRNIYGSADPYVIAVARNRNCVVLTNELPHPKAHLSNEASLSKVPDVCLKMGISCLTMEQLMFQEKWKF